jgi:hypothetical protein
MGSNLEKRVSFRHVLLLVAIGCRARRLPGDERGSTKGKGAGRREFFPSLRTSAPGMGRALSPSHAAAAGKVNCRDPSQAERGNECCGLCLLMRRPGGRVKRPALDFLKRGGER